MLGIPNSVISYHFYCNFSDRVAAGRCLTFSETPISCNFVRSGNMSSFLAKGNDNSGELLRLRCSHFILLLPQRAVWKIGEDASTSSLCTTTEAAKRAAGDLFLAPQAIVL